MIKSIARMSQEIRNIESGCRIILLEQELFAESSTTLLPRKASSRIERRWIKTLSAEERFTAAREIDLRLSSANEDFLDLSDIYVATGGNT